jgi:hypothetical protein
MKSFTAFILEATSICNQSGEGKYCPSHGTKNCSKLKSYKTVNEIAKKHRLDVSFIKHQLEMGIPIEHEHTKDKVLATDIALQHLDEIPDYYTRLKKMEASAKKEHKKFKDVKEELDGKTPRDLDYSLRDWFKGWVQTGGKYDGKPCARQPGQTTKPYCRDADVRASMSKEERDERAAKKRREDPNPNRSGDAKIVTQEECIQEKKGEKDACYHKVKSRYKIWPSAYASGALVKCRKVGASNWGNKTEKTNVDEEYTRIQSRGLTYTVLLSWKGQHLSVQIFFPKSSRPTKDEVVFEIRKIYPNATVFSYAPSIKDPTKPLLFTGI